MSATGHPCLAQPVPEAIALTFLVEMRILRHGEQAPVFAAQAKGGMDYETATVGENR